VRREAEADLDSDAFGIEPPPDLVGATIGGRYRVVGLLGAGGMGSVYEVEHLRLGRHFALKLLRPDWVRDRKMVERFEREARAAAALSSQYVVSIQDCGELPDGRPYFVMERLVGQDLGQLLKSCGQLPIARAANLGIDACLGLAAAHASGLVHRDLKPENLFVTTSDEGRDLCKLLDFGVAKLESHDQTRPGALMGTARYMAPEQVALDVEVGPRADVFAMGVILYQCLSGSHPFEADSLERVLFKIMNDEAPPLTEIAPHVPGDLAELIATAMKRSPDLRPSSALEFASRLLPFAGERRGILHTRPWQLEAERDDAPNSDRETPTDFEPAIPIAIAPRAVARRSRYALPLLSGLGLVSLALFFGLRYRERPTAEPQQPARNEAASVALTPPPAVTPTHAPPPEPASTETTTADPAPRPSAEVVASRNASPTAAQRIRPAPRSSGPSPDRWFDPKNPYVR